MKPSIKLFCFLTSVLIYSMTFSQIESLDTEFSFLEANESNGRVYIKWGVFNDVLFENMILQRSSDAQVWSNIHYATTAGDYKQSKIYHFIDVEASKGLSYYRVLLVKRGKPTIKSKVKAVKIDNKGEVRCFPNPTTGVVNFYIDSKEHTRGYLRVINGNGFIEHYEVIEIEEGISAFKRDFSQLDQGIYLIKLDCDSGLSFSQQEIIQN